MEDKELIQLHEWGLRVSRLLELIALTNRTIQLHKEHGSTQEQISDYNSLLAEHNSELNDLMQTYGLTIKIQPLESAA